MKLCYRLFRRNNGIFFIEDRTTKKQESLKTRDKAAAARIFHARNEAHEQPAINLQIARAYVHLRKLHNFCLDMNWLPWPIIPKRQ